MFLKPQIMPCSKVPGEFAVKASLHFDRQCRDRRGSKFRMALVEKVLSNDCRLEILERSPRQSEIETEIARHAQRAQPVHVAEPHVELPIVWQVDAGPD